jgi:hypothetical protein
MRVRAISPEACASGLLLLLALSAGCSRPQQVALREEMRLGQFRLRVVSVEVYTRDHQGVPLEVEVQFSLNGGNRFDRADFAENVSRHGRLYFRTAAGWRQRVWMLSRGDNFGTLVLHANPPRNSRGYVLEIGNPYGSPSKFVVDLGR